MVPLSSVARVSSADFARRLSRLGPRSVPASWHDAQSCLKRTDPSWAAAGLAKTIKSAEQPSQSSERNFFFIVRPSCAAVPGEAIQHGKHTPIGGSLRRLRSQRKGQTQSPPRTRRS
jgi:hypothetical protein